MERLSPIHQTEAAIPNQSAGGGLRLTVYAGLALLLAAGGWVRFNDRIAAVSPVLAGPAAMVAAERADRAAAASGVKSLVEAALVPVSDTEAAVARMNLPADNATALVQDVERGRLRLVSLPLFDAGTSSPAGTPMQTVQVSSGGYTRLLQLTRAPQSVTLPISRIGTVSLQTTSKNAVSMAALTLNGPVPLPDLSSGQELDVGIVAQ